MYKKEEEVINMEQKGNIKAQCPWKGEKVYMSNGSEKHQILVYFAQISTLQLNT